MHTIRLRGPWHYFPLCRTVWTAEGKSEETAGSVPAAGSMTIPGDWQETLGDEFYGRVRYERHFHCPTGLAQQDQVFIVIDRLDALGSVTLNGQPLGNIPPAADPTRFEITVLLQQHNQLEIIVDLPVTQAESAPLPRPDREQLAGGLIGEVKLEIQPAVEAKIL